MIKDEIGIQKLQLTFDSSDDITIDLDKMELDEYCEAIEEYIVENYKELLEIKPEESKS